MNIVVTGASRGIGREIVLGFLKSTGNKVLAISRNAAMLSDLQKTTEAKGFTSKPDVLSMDITSDSDVAVLHDYLLENYRHSDVLINNAGLLINKAVGEFSAVDFDRTMAVNFKAPFFLVQSLSGLFSSPSHIVNIGSMGGYQSSAKFPGMSVYSASKAALAIFSECLAEEWKDRGVSVNTLALGAVNTEMLREAFPAYKAPVSAAEMASFIIDFAKNGNKFFNGKVIPVSSSTP